MSVDGPGRERLRELAARLKEAGTDGKGLRRELMSELDKAAQPIARKIADPAHLAPYMPDRYAAILAGDLSVGAQRILSGNPRVSIRAKARAHRRKVRLLDAGLISHPKWPDHRPRSQWEWQNGQTGGMKAGFFSDPCREAAPEIREHVLAAITETLKKIANG